MKWVELLARNGLLGWYLRACTSCMDGYVGKYDGAKIETVIMCVSMKNEIPSERGTRFSKLKLPLSRSHPYPISTLYHHPIT